MDELIPKVTRPLYECLKILTKGLCSHLKYLQHKLYKDFPQKKKKTKLSKTEIDDRVEAAGFNKVSRVCSYRFSVR